MPKPNFDLSIPKIAKPQPVVIEDGGFAFPQLSIESGERNGHGDLIAPITASQGGMSKRDYFATHAPAVPRWFELLAVERNIVQRQAEPGTAEGFAVFEESVFAAWPYYYADMMIAQRKKP